jgi:hypothetical protein
MDIDTITWEQEIDKETGVVCWECYRLNGEYHRDSREGPAIIQRDPDGQISVESYFWRGKQHRPDGPAEIAYFSNGVIWEEIVTPSRDPPISCVTPRGWFLWSGILFGANRIVIPGLVPV